MFSWYKCLIVNLVFSHHGFWRGVVVSDKLVGRFGPTLFTNHVSCIADKLRSNEMML